MIKIKPHLALSISVFSAAVIFVFSVVPSVRVGPVNNSGSLVHIAAYFVLTFFVSIYFFVKKKKNCFLLSIITAFSYGVFIEILQHFIPYRSFGITDMFMNLTGAILSLLPFHIYRTISK